MDASHVYRVNPLLECCAQLFAVAVPLRSANRATEVGADLREQVLNGFDVLERTAFERQISTAVVQDAKYALAAFIDEAVLGSSWSGRMEWMNRPLQLEQFGEHLAGEGFFTRLANLRQGGEQNMDLLELYYTCLQLGFEGMYKLRGLEQLMALQVDLRSQIDGYRGVADPRLSPEGVAKAGMFARMGRHIPYWVIVVVTTAGLFFGYGGYATMSQRVTDTSLQAIAQDHQQIVNQYALRGLNKEASR
jgi:type VI secretion system protein ImpK